VRTVEDSPCQPYQALQNQRREEFIVSDAQHLSEHERDAALGAVGASMMMSQAAGWRNLASDEDDAFAPVSPVEYWMPLGGPDQ